MGSRGPCAHSRLQRQVEHEPAQDGRSELHLRLLLRTQWMQLRTAGFGTRSKEELLLRGLRKIARRRAVMKQPPLTESLTQAGHCSKHLHVMNKQPEAFHLRSRMCSPLQYNHWATSAPTFLSTNFILYLLEVMKCYILNTAILLNEEAFSINSENTVLYWRRLFPGRKGTYLGLFEEASFVMVSKSHNPPELIYNDGTASFSLACSALL